MGGGEKDFLEEEGRRRRARPRRKEGPMCKFRQFLKLILGELYVLLFYRIVKTLQTPFLHIIVEFLHILFLSVRLAPRRKEGEGKSFPLRFPTFSSQQMRQKLEEKEGGGGGGNTGTTSSFPHKRSEKKKRKEKESAADSILSSPLLFLENGTPLQKCQIPT